MDKNANGSGACGAFKTPWEAGGLRGRLNYMENHVEENFAGNGKKSLPCGGMCGILVISKIW
jgi:hypothetical protein